MLNHPEDLSQKSLNQAHPKASSLIQNNLASLLKQMNQYLRLQALRCHKDQGYDLGNTKDQPNVEEASKNDWTRIPINLSKPLPLIKDQGRQVVLANYFFNNDLEYLKGRSLSKKYTTFTIKIKAVKYDTIEGIEDMVPSLWSLVKVAYKKYAMLGILQWGLKRQSFNGYASNRKSKHDVFSTKRIITVTHVKVVKKYDYGYLDEVIVRREDQKLHKFIEGDFPRLNLRDIEDMLLLLVQKSSPI
nr:hypothetical protein [Tanacetum cinerariifolium]